MTDPSGPPHLDRTIKKDDASPGEADALTRDAYDRYAATYADLYFGTRALDADMDAFLALLPPHPVILDAGCGPGHQAFYFASRGAVAFGIDNSLPMLREGRRREGRLLLVQGDLLQLPLPDRSLDGVWARASLIHMDDDALRQALGETRRVLHPGGVFYAAVRQGSGEEVRRETKQGTEMARYFRFRTPEEWRSWMEAYGFEIIEQGIEEGDPEDWVWSYARLRRE